MKRLILSSLVGIFASSFITACGTQSDLVLDNTLQVNQDITAQSRAGLNDTYKHLLNYQFSLLDLNKDKFISVDEFAPAYEIPNSASNMVPIYDNTNKKPSLVSRVVNFFKKKPNQKVLNDIYARFAAVDKNKDTKISLQEAQKETVYFLGRSKDNLRDMAEFSFAMTDTNKDKKVTKEEFSKYSNTSGSLLVTFYSADKNKDNVLKFSEYEDMLYAVIKFYANNPVQPTPVQPVPSEPILNEPTVPDTGYGNPSAPDTGYGSPSTPDYGYGNPSDYTEIPAEAPQQ